MTNETPTERIIRRAAERLREQNKFSSQILREAVTVMRGNGVTANLVIGVDAEWLIEKIEKMEKQIADLQAELKRERMRSFVKERRGS